MTAIRRRLSSIGLLLLVFQAGTFAMSPIASCCTATAQAAQDDEDCCKGTAPGQMCPLHHHRVPSNGSSQQHDESSHAMLRCGCATSDPALISLGLGVGIMPLAVSVNVNSVSLVVVLDDESARSNPSRLEPPPPRR